MRRLHRRDGRLAGFYAVNEVALVVGGFVELHLAHFFRQRLEIVPLGLGTLKSSTIHPDPAFGADPFGAALDVGMSARDGHRDVVRVFQFNAILRAGVPDRLLVGKVAVTFDLRRPGIVAVHAPVRDVAMVSNPVQQLPAAGVVIPAPVHVDARLDVRLHLRRSDPGFIVEFWRRLRYSHVPGRGAGDNRRQFFRIARGQFFQQLGSGAGKIVVARRQSDFDMRDLADESVAHDLRALVEIRDRPLPRAGLPDAFVFLHGPHNRLLLGDGFRERLLAIDVLLVVERLDRDKFVPVVRHCNHHGVNVRARHQFAVVVVRLAVLVFVMVVDRPDRLPQMIFVQVTRGDDLAVVQSEKRFRVSRSLHAPAHHAERDAI